MKMTKVERIVKEWTNINETAKRSGYYEISRVASRLSIEEEEDIYHITYQMNKEDLTTEVKRNDRNLLAVCYVFAVYAEKMKKAIREVSKRKMREDISDLSKWLSNFTKEYFV